MILKEEIVSHHRFKVGRRELAEARIVEAEEGSEEDNPRPVARRKGKKASGPRKRELTLGS